MLEGSAVFRESLCAVVPKATAGPEKAPKAAATRRTRVLTDVLSFKLSSESYGVSFGWPPVGVDPARVGVNVAGAVGCSGSRGTHHRREGCKATAAQ